MSIFTVSNSDGKDNYNVEFTKLDSNSSNYNIVKNGKVILSNTVVEENASHKIVIEHN
jgi:hypothetical protein